MSLPVIPAGYDPGMTRRGGPLHLIECDEDRALSACGANHVRLIPEWDARARRWYLNPGAVPCRKCFKMASSAFGSDEP
jgi:hypothetical protein